MVMILVAFLVKSIGVTRWKWVWLVAAAIVMTIAVFLGIQFGTCHGEGLWPPRPSPGSPPGGRRHRDLDGVVDARAAGLDCPGNFGRACPTL